METMQILPCADSDEMAELRRSELSISRDMAIYQSRIVVEAVRSGHYENDRGEKVDWKREVVNACLAKISIPPWRDLPPMQREPFPTTQVQVSNQTTVDVLLRMLEQGRHPLALNFANGTEPGGGFLRGARAQEEAICRVSSLYWTLTGDAMYLHHSYRESADSTDWAILSPQVPIFRSDGGIKFDKPVLADFITCAAPYTPSVGQPTSGNLLRDRIHRVLAIARAYGYTSLVLGAWGCGAFANNPKRTASDFRDALEGEFAGAFSEIAFAITDWSAERKYLRPFDEVFSAQ